MVAKYSKYVDTAKPYMPYIIGAVGATVLYLVMNRKQDVNNPVRVTGKTQTGTKVTVDVATVANLLYDEIKPDSWFTDFINTDEKRIIKLIKGVPIEGAQKLRDMYNKMYRRNLRADLIRVMDEKEWSQISYMFE